MVQHQSPDGVFQEEITMAKNAHLTLDQRATIEVSLREGASFTEIGRGLGKDPSTISKEVKNHSLCYIEFDITQIAEVSMYVVNTLRLQKV